MPDDFSRRWGEFSPTETAVIEARFRNLCEMYESFKTLMIPFISGGFRLSKTILYDICCLYVNDLKEYKIFHNEEKSGDDCKRAAYLARLISNHRPLQIAELNVKTNDPRYYKALISNELFAIFAFETYLRVPKAMFSSIEYARIRRDLIFAFSFRDPQKELLVVIAGLVKTIAQGYRTKPSLPLLIAPSDEDL